MFDEVYILFYFNIILKHNGMSSTKNVPPALTFINSVFCPHIIYVFLMDLRKKTAIISLYSNDLSIFITKAECLLRSTNCVFNCDRYSFVLKGLK